MVMLGSSQWRFPPASRERRAAEGFTGRYLLTFENGTHDVMHQVLTSAQFERATPVRDASVAPRPLKRGGYFLLPNVPVGIIDPLPEQEVSLHTDVMAHGLARHLEPERIVRAVGEPTISTDYVAGWRDAIAAFSAKALGSARPAVADAGQAPVAVKATWGLQAINVLDSKFTGAGVKVAILDTGLDLSHPDFAGRQITTMNFVGDDTPFHDGVGHGTHCTGTALGPVTSGAGQRYGIASGAVICSGRVLDDTGRGGDANIIQGIDWAVAQGCDVISMSLEAPWSPGDPPFSPAYEAVALYALARGCILVVAAGNDANNGVNIGAVGTPGNSPSVITVAAVDVKLATASFSNRLQASAPGVKEPDVAAPGVGIFSAWPVAKGSYNTISGTSMATPHVAGVAALLAEANPNTRGAALRGLVLQQFKKLPDPAGEVGQGLIWMPSS